MTWLRSARTATGELIDLRIAAGVIAEVRPAAGQAAEADVDLTGHVLLPSFVEPHAHLDKALTAARAHNATGDLAGAIGAMRALSAEMTVPEIVERAHAAIRIQLAWGTTAIRTHVNVGAESGLRALDALIEVRERWRGTVDLQLVALVHNPLSGQPGRDLRTALRNGADVAGGCPHLDSEPDRAVAICLDAAGEAGVPLAMHTDETLDPGRLTLATMADLVRRTGFAHGVTASHCVSLGVQSETVQHRVSEAVAGAGIAVVALPQTNLFLQGREHPEATPRGLTAVGPLRRAGATLAAGGDNLRDPFHPLGRGDALEVAALMVTAGHLDPAAAIDSVTAASRTALGLPPVTLSAGAAADLVALPGTDLLDVLGAAPAARTVWKAGRVVARTTVDSSIADPVLAVPEAVS